MTAADPFDDLFGSYPETIQQIGARARALIRESLPAARERIYPTGWTVAQYALGPKMSDTVAVIKPAKQHVMLGLEGGALLDDPEHLLEGTGKGARHVKLRSLADVDRPAVRALLEAAAAGR